MILGARALLTSPKLRFPTRPFGLRNCAWLKALNISTRNWTNWLSAIGNCFWMPNAKLFSPGPLIGARSEFPKNPRSVFWKQLVSRNWRLLRRLALARTPEQVRFGRCPTNGLPVRFGTVMKIGKPFENSPIVVTVQPPSA